MRFPALFVNHGGGPMPLMGRQPALVDNMKEISKNLLPRGRHPKAIVVISAHWESNPIRITAAEKPSMYFDYYGFPPETYKYEYPAPGSPDLARRIQNLLSDEGLESELDTKRGFDHGVFIPLMIMYPKATVPVVCVSLHASLSSEINLKIGSALSPLRDEKVLILGSGYTFHNMDAFFNPSKQTVQASIDFNTWLKDTIMSSTNTNGLNQSVFEKLAAWEKAPGARVSHPREEHLLPLFVITAAAGLSATPQLIYDTTIQKNGQTDHAVTGYLFQ